MSQRESLFVLSDLHLGGDTGFQMCTRHGRERLAALLRNIPKQVETPRRAHVVLAGDIVDFLAEKPFSAFTANDAEATRKLARLMEHGDTADVWAALRGLVAAGHWLTLMLGNHDIELSLPGPRRLLHERLGSRGIEFLYDNQAFVRGPVLIEHGNRYDKWNNVPHDMLRAVRSALSRREEPPALRPVPGSEVVVRVMNRLKQRYAFVDLLKPENEAVLPLLAVLDPSVLGELEEIATLVPRTWVRRDEDGVPLDPELIAAPDERNLLREARVLLGQDDEEIGWRETVRSWWEVYLAATAEERPESLSRLRKALRLYAEAQYKTFNVEEEAPAYQKAAEALERRGFRVVVFGHTHLVKRVRLPEGGLYLNTGTWADLMRIPDEVLSDGSEGDKVLEEFVKALAENQVDPWREHVPTYARIELEGDTLLSADVFVYREDGSSEPVPPGVLPRGLVLAPKKG